MLLHQYWELVNDSRKFYVFVYKFSLQSFQNIGE